MEYLLYPLAMAAVFLLWVRRLLKAASCDVTATGLSEQVSTEDGPHLVVDVVVGGPLISSATIGDARDLNKVVCKVKDRPESTLRFVAWNFALLGFWAVPTPPTRITLVGHLKKKTAHLRLSLWALVQVAQV